MHQMGTVGHKIHMPNLFACRDHKGVMIKTAEGLVVLIDTGKLTKVL